MKLAVKYIFFKVINFFNFFKKFLERIYRDGDRRGERNNNRDRDGDRRDRDRGDRRDRGGDRERDGSMDKRRGPKPNDSCFNCGNEGHWYVKS